jgi:Family of unknown function (DUF5767)
MPPKRKKYKIVKVSLGYEPQFRPPQFEPVSRLYMELLENKTKIKEGLRKLEFESKQFGGNLAPSIDAAHKEAMNDVNKDINESEEGIASHVTSASNTESSHVGSSNHYENKFVKAYQESKEYSSSEHRLSPNFDEDKEGEYKAGMFKNLLHSKQSSPGSGYKSSNKFIIGEDEEPLYPSSIKSSPSHSPSGSPYREKSNRGSDSIAKIMRGEISDDDNNEIDHRYSSSVGLSSLNAKAVSLSTAKEESYNKVVPSYVQPQSHVSSRTIPSLEAISKNQVPLMSGGDVSSAPNVANMSYTGTEKDLQRKKDLLYKFKILKRQYTNGFVPEVNEFMDLNDLEREYESITRQLRLDEQVENYKKFLIMGFFGLEMILKTFLKFQDIEGFANQQIVGINQYEKILLEIGEKHTISPSSQWPPELRLAGMVCMNAVVFLGTRMLFKSSSGNIMSSLFGGSSKSASSSPPSMNFGGSASSGSSGSSAPKKKMRGPDLDIEDLDAKKIN